MDIQQSCFSGVTCYKLEFSRNFARFRRFGSQQHSVSSRYLLGGISPEMTIPPSETPENFFNFSNRLQAYERNRTVRCDFCLQIIRSVSFCNKIKVDKQENTVDVFCAADNKSPNNRTRLSLPTMIRATKFVYATSCNMTLKCYIRCVKSYNKR